MISQSIGGYSLTAYHGDCLKGIYLYLPSKQSRSGGDLRSTGNNIAEFSYAPISPQPTIFKDNRQRALTCVMVTNDDMMDMVGDEDNAGACIALPSQINGVGCDVEGASVLNLNQYREERRGSKCGRLALQP